MIPMADILAWRAQYPWQSLEQVEQDLIISRMLVELFRDTVVSKKLLFRGGTALHKLVFDSPLR